MGFSNGSKTPLWLQPCLTQVRAADEAAFMRDVVEGISKINRSLFGIGALRPKRGKKRRERPGQSLSSGNTSSSVTAIDTVSGNAVKCLLDHETEASRARCIVRKAVAQAVRKLMNNIRNRTRSKLFESYLFEIGIIQMLDKADKDPRAEGFYIEWSEALLAGVTNERTDRQALDSVSTSTATLAIHQQWKIL